jgi:hypothetical protein
MSPELRLDLGQRRCICDLLLDRGLLGGPLDRRCCLALLVRISPANSGLQWPFLRQSWLWGGERGAYTYHTLLHSHLSLLAFEIGQLLITI